MKKTPLYEVHIKLGGRMIDFGGWALPVQYTGIIEEHLAVREKAGLFDVSHMGEIIVEGPDAASYIQGIITNDITGLCIGQISYSPMCYHNGGVVDDLLVYKLNDEKFLIIVNASNTDKDYEWMKSNLAGNVLVENVSDKYAQLALQGPESESILQKLANIPLSDIKFYNFRENVNIGGITSIVSRTGYTGEDGFEIYVDSDKAEAMWNLVMEAGKDKGLVPAGLGARDTLRFEAALPLYGHELSPGITPLEVGLEKFVKLEKECDFIGKQALVEQKEKGLKRKLAGFKMIDRGLPRNGYDVEVNGEKIGYVTTGGFSPSLKLNIGLALISAEYAKKGTEIGINIRGKAVRAEVVKKPFYSKKYKK